jgi:hypothetical protein
MGAGGCGGFAAGGAGRGGIAGRGGTPPGRGGAGRATGRSARAAGKSASPPDPVKDGFGAGGGPAFTGSGGDFGRGLAAGSAGSSEVPPAPSPTIVIFRFCLGGGGVPAAGVTAPLVPGAFTENVCPHFGQRIFSPCGGTLRSST